MKYQITFQMVALILLVFASIAAQAQIVGATISGAVKDSTGAALSGARNHSLQCRPTRARA